MPSRRAVLPNRSQARALLELHINGNRREGACWLRRGDPRPTPTLPPHAGEAFLLALA